MKKTAFILFITLFIPFTVNAAEGMLNVESQFSVKATADRLEKLLNEKGMAIFNRINHSESAVKIDVPLRGTELIIFGNPKAGSPLMQCQQSIAIDLPQKALIWKDENSKVWISYNDTRYLAKRHDVQGCQKVISKIEQILTNVTTAAAN